MLVANLVTLSEYQLQTLLTLSLSHQKYHLYLALFPVCLLRELPKEYQQDDKLNRKVQEVIRKKIKKKLMS